MAQLNPDLRKAISVLLFIFCFASGWFLGYIKAPWFEVSENFWAGFLCCAAAVILFMLISALFRNKLPVSSGIEENSLTDSTKRPYRIPLGLPLTLFLTASICFGIISFVQYRLLKSRYSSIQSDLTTCQDDAGVAGQLEKTALLTIMVEKLDSIRMLTADATRQKPLIDQIVALSSAFSVYKEWDPGSRSFQSLSSPRGMLLLALLKAELDSASWAIIKQNVSFADADLRTADLHGTDLNGIDLRRARLERSNLQGCKLQYANLNRANLQDANLNQADLKGANVKSADLSHAKINGAYMLSAQLDTADFSFASLYGSDLTLTTLLAAKFQNTILTGSNLTSSHLQGTLISKSVLKGANLFNTYIASSTIEEPDLDSAIVKPTFLDELKRNSNKGVPNILSSYKIVADSTTYRDSLIYRLLR